MEQWPKILFTYGPFALLILFVFVIEKKTRTALGDGDVPKRLSVSLYVLNWLVIFLLGGAVTYLWIVTNLPREAMIEGTLENLSDQQKVYSESANLYLARHYSPGKNRYGYDWRLISPKPLLDGTTETLYITQGSDDNSRSFMYQLPIHESFYKSPVRLTYEAKTLHLVLDHEGKQETLAPKDDVDTSVRPIDTNLNSAFPIVYAQEGGDIDDIFQRLDSDDPIIRRDARRDLAAQGQNALPKIDAALKDPKTNYRVRLGVIAALNQMKGVTISQEARAAVAAAAKDSDPVLSSEAATYLYKLPPSTCGVRCGGERWPVKSLSDSYASSLRSKVPRLITVNELVSQRIPEEISDTSRVALEQSVVTVRAFLIGWKAEIADRDYHMVIADLSDTNHQMIVEIPSPECQGACSSLFFPDFVRSRQNADRQLGTASHLFKKLDRPWLVEVTGIPFFDFFHAQLGAALNCIEIHPVTDIKFISQQADSIPLTPVGKSPHSCVRR